jgi:hypothetical protein
MAKFPYGISGSGQPRKLLSDWELLLAYGEEGGLPGFAGNVGVPIHERTPAEFTDDWYTYQNPDWSAPLWQEGAFSPPPSEPISPPQSVSNEILPDLRSEFPGLYERSGIEAPLVTYGEVVDRPGGHRDVFDFSEQQLGPAPTQRLEPEVSGEQRYTPEYHSTIPMGYAPYDPNRQTGFFSNLGRRLMGGVTAPYRHFTDISDVPVTGSGIGAAASTFGPLLASAAIPGGGLFSLLSRMIPDSGPTPYQQEGQNVTDISFGPKTAWLGADVPGGGYYIPNQKVDMAQLGGGRTPGGRGITVHTPEGLVDATYRVDPTGAASITSDDFGAPNVDYGDIYYGGADYEGLDISDDGSGDQWDAYWGDW